MFSQSEYDGGARRGWIPREWHDIVCICVDPKYQRGISVNHKDLFTRNCTICHKYARWMLGRCRNCKQLYIAFFVHPESGATCYDCLVEQYGPDSFTIDRPPGNYVPRPPLSAEELSAELDNFFIPDSDDLPDF